MDGLIRKPDSTSLSKINKEMNCNEKEMETIIEKEKDNKDL